MRDLLKYIEKVAGGYTEAASSLGYTARQYYNIRKRIESSEPLLPEVETKILQKIILLLINQIETVNKESQS